MSSPTLHLSLEIREGEPMASMDPLARSVRCNATSSTKLFSMIRHMISIDTTTHTTQRTNETEEHKSFVQVTCLRPCLKEVGGEL